MGRKRFSIQIEGTADAAFAVDDAGQIIAWNKAAAELFGLAESEVMNVSCHTILQCADDNGMVCSERCVVERTAQDNRPVANFDLRVQTKIGKLWCNLSTLLASDPTTEARQAIYFVRPREMRKRLEQALSEFVRKQTGHGEKVATTIPSTTINVRLTPREIEVLRSLAKGQSTRGIANQLNISSSTVNNHIKHILTKLDAHTRLEAIRHAESVGVI
jgi:PAS domain S-box-containing protein